MAAALKRTPLYEEHLALGARMVPFAGWQMPLDYGDAVEEHKDVRSSAGVFDMGHMAEFRVFGPGSFEFLQGLLTNDLSRIAELGRAQYTLMLDDDGHIVDDLFVYHTGDLEYLLIGNACNAETDFAWLASRAPAGLEIVDESERTALIALQGPHAVRIATELAGAGWEAPERGAVREAALDTVPALVARTGCTGEDGVEILSRAADAPRLWRAILSFAEVNPIGLTARDTLRLEIGYPNYGNDIDRTVDPVSAGLGRAVPPSKSGYVGAEAVARIRAEGPQRARIGLTVDGSVPSPGMSLLHGGEVVGMVSSSTFSPTLENGIVIAYVPVAFAAPGTRIEVEVSGEVVCARVVEMPFVSSRSLSA